MTSRFISVANRAALMAALNAARGGETIILADGNYGNATFSRLNFEQPVTIKGGTFSSIAFSQSSGITLDDTTVNFTPSLTSTKNSQAIRVWASRDITITDAQITGGPSINGVPIDATVLDSTGNVLGLPVGQGINISSSQRITVSSSDIALFHKGVVMAASSNIVIADNTIHDLRTTPISGSVTSNLTITGNHTYNSTPWRYGGDGDHGDRIHIWTGDTPIRGLVIANNKLEQGTGAPMMGIYLDDNGKGLGFIDAVISGNRLTDGHGQGVLLENVTGMVANNILTWSGFGTAHNNAPRFDIAKGTNDLTLSGNSGPVSIRNGAYDITVTEHSGRTILSKDLSASALETIVLDAQAFTAQNSAALGDKTGALIFVGNGDFHGTGNAHANKIVGGTGNDTLIGNGGADILEGRLGNDSYYVDNQAQQIIDTGGVDTVYSSVDWRLQSGLENLIYTGTGGATLEGNQANNRIVGGSGNDTLVANGGRDILEGGLGNDSYVLGSASHSIIDTGGIDTVITDVSYRLPEGLENLNLSGSANANATGNASNNVLRGNAGNNTLDGGLGVDVMHGGAGNDIYIVDNVGDRAVETEDDGKDSGGIDLIRSFLDSFALDAGIENLTYVGTSNFTGTGNDLANTITGGGGNDRLFGGNGNDRLVGGLGDDIFDGGPGADILIGGQGNDIFVLVKGQSHGDVINDFFGNGAIQGDSIKLIGWGEGTTITNGASNVAGDGSTLKRTQSSNVWQIRDGIDGTIELVTVFGTIHPTDFFFG